MNKGLMILLLTLLQCVHTSYLHAAQGNYVHVEDSVQLYYQQAGLGQQAIVFIPGWSMSSQIFKYQLTHFNDSQTFNVLAFDPRGQGQSSKPNSGYTYAQRGKDLAAFIEKMDLNNVVLVGWSFGTLDMLSYISQYGLAKVKAVVVLDGSPTTMLDTLNNSWAWIDRLDSQSSRRTTTLAVLTKPRKFYQQFAVWMLDNPSPEKINEIVNIAMQTPPFVAALTNETASYANYEKTLTDLEGKVPIYYIVRDEWASIVESWRKKNTPSAQLTSMGRHLMFWEHHSVFNQILEDFLDKL
jgi:pimeloyl-ACP methyl ester carboxylesterase